MSERAKLRWAALRELHEDWGTPLELLQRATKPQSNDIEKRALVEGWNVHQSTRGLYTQLIETFENQLTKFRGARSEGDDEKGARALSIMAKTLETIVTTEAKLKQVSQKQSDPKNGALDETTSNRGTDDDRNTISSADRTSEIDKALTRLVDGLVQSRGH